MKLQELLNKHKDKLWDWRYNNIELDDHIDFYFIDCDSNWFKVSFSLLDLLFSTPFLSLLEWKKWWSLWTERDNINWLSMKTLFWGSSDYHKINLVLFNTDEERIKYIEEFTL